MIKAFRDQWLDDYYFGGKKSSHIPGAIEGALRRKLKETLIKSEFPATQGCVAKICDASH